MKIFIERTGKEIELPFEGTVKELLHTLNINSEVVLVSRGKELLVESDPVRPDDCIAILSVVSGG